MPSRRSSSLITAVANALGSLGKLPVHPVLTASDASDVTPDRFQADMANSAHQVGAVWERLRVDAAQLADEVPVGPVLLVDDEINSRWTMTVAAYRLRSAGTGLVLPFVLRTR
jgi:ATP-dependent DNA helicase RecQ